MTELAPGSFIDVGLNLLPVILVVADFFAVRTNRQEGLELLDLSRETQYPLGHSQAHPQMHRPVTRAAISYS